MNFDAAIVYDVETTVNCFTLNAQGLFSDLDVTFEISHFRDDRALLFQWFDYWRDNDVPMISFNGIAFDYPVIHYIYENPRVTVEQIFAFAQDIIQSQSRFGRIVWESDRFAPQIDLLKVHHMDNRAKMTSLKALQFVMRADNVLEMPLPFDQPIAAEHVDGVLIPYNKHDVAETKRFALFSLAAIKFRIGLRETLHGDVLNWSDTKIGSKILEQRLGDELCYERSADGKFPRQTFRTSIALNDIIFPYVEFRHPEFNRVLSWMRTQTLRADEFQVDGEGGGKIRTKGVFTGVHANVGGVAFEFGTGGIHASVESQRFVADDEFAIVDIDVASLYPNIAIVNRLYPEHLGERFVEEYARLPQERKEWQKKTGKKGTEANAMKLASNGTYGNSNNAYSVFYDPKFTMTITINGQLLLCMLAEWLLMVDTLQIIMVNTDGITYRIHRSRMRHAEIVRNIWMRLTRLELEEVRYTRLWVRDVNSYIAEYE